VPPTGTAPPAGTGPPGVSRQFARWTCFAVAVITLPAGGYGAATQHSSGPVVLAAAGAVALVVWWLLRPRRRDRRPRRLAAGARAAAVTDPGLGEHPELAERGDPELTALRQAWQEGQPLSAPGLTVPADGGLLLRPARSGPPAGRRGAAGVAAAALLVALLGVRVLAGGLVVLIAVAAGAGLLAAALTVIALIRFQAGVARLTTTEVSAPTWYGRRRRVARDRIRRVVLVSADLSSLRPLTVPMLLIIGDEGRCLLPVSGAGVAGAALYAFTAATGAPAGVRYDRMDPAALRREYPGSVSWYWAHQILTGILISAAIVAIVTAAVLMTQV
jgi:hypothetical protein